MLVFIFIEVPFSRLIYLFYYFIFLIFNKLQTMKPFLNMIINNEFQSFVIFPVIKAKKEFGDYGFWIVKIAILQ